MTGLHLFCVVVVVAITFFVCTWVGTQVIAGLKDESLTTAQAVWIAIKTGLISVIVVSAVTIF